MWIIDGFVMSTSLWTPGNYICQDSTNTPCSPYRLVFWNRKLNHHHQSISNINPAATRKSMHKVVQLHTGDLYRWYFDAYCVHYACNYCICFFIRQHISNFGWFSPFWRKTFERPWMQKYSKFSYYLKFWSQFFFQSLFPIHPTTCAMAPSRPL